MQHLHRPSPSFSLPEYDRGSVALFAFGRLPACSQIPTFHAAASPPKPIFVLGRGVLESLCSFVALVACRHAAVLSLEILD